MGKVTLSEIVSLPAFEDAGSLFYRATGMTISFHDEHGNTVFYPKEERCGFCQLIQSTTEGAKRCLQSDKRAAERALREGMPLAYKCHAGLTDVVVPVVVGGKSVGCFYSGQSLLTPPTTMGYQETRALVDDLGIDPNLLWEAYFGVGSVEESRLEIAMGLLGIICSHLVESEMALRRERILTLEQRRLRKVAEENARLEKDLREMELRLVQAQLNPHFLFNALNLILGNAMAENASRTSELVESLSVLLRDSLTRIGSKLTLSEEAASARAYVAIFGARFDKRVEFAVDIPPRLENVKVPALILQPLVENALVHALPPGEHSLALSVAAAQNGDRVEIRVCDNGASLPTESLRAARKLIDSVDPEGKMTGLAGLSRRLRYYYGENAELRMDPLERGLAVVISLPRE